MAQKPGLLIVAGPTASGKTACAVELALRLGGEVVSADSMQVYRGMDILTAMPTREEMRGVKHHMLGVADPREKFSAAAYREQAMQCVADIRAQGGVPILCGGTGLYIDALTRPMGFGERGSDEIRAELGVIAQKPGGREALHAMLRAVDPESAARLHPNDVRRVVRAIEIHRLTGRTQTEQALYDAQREGPFDERMFVLDWPREELYRRIDLRVDKMLAAGLVDEVRRLMADGDNDSTAKQAIGYKEIAAALRGECTMEAAVMTLKQVTRNYAKRQLTWFRRDPRARWVPASGRSAADIADEIAALTQGKAR
jgi:tRNA dimethylallyltransferase